jgi:hypothetical protein
MRRVRAAGNWIVGTRRWPVLPSVVGGITLGGAGVVTAAPVRGIPGVLALLCAALVAIHAGPRAGAVVAIVVG